MTWWWRALASPWHFLRDAHPFFLTLVVLIGPAVIAAASADSNTPGYALNSVWIYRIQVGLVFFLIEYTLLIAIWLAYQGRSVGEIQLPGGAGFALKDPAKQTADSFEQFRKTTEAQLANDNKSIALLNDIVTGIPQPGDRFVRRLRWVLFGYAQPEDRPDPREHRRESDPAQADE